MFKPPAVPSVSSAPHRYDHAVVIGGSIAGLLAARVLMPYFQRVTLLEREQLPAAPEFRRGVPQDRHLHVLLKRGRLILEELFPGLQAELIAAGATLIDMANDAAWLSPAGWGIRFPSDIITLSCSRVLLEWTIRQRMLALPQVQLHQGCDVQELVASPDRSTLLGVRVRSSAGAAETESVLADLVVDASGRQSRMPQWLEALGYTAPETTVISANLGYASRLYRRPTHPAVDWQGLYVQAAPPKATRGGVLLPIEGDRWIVTLAGGDGDYPPTDEQGFLDFAQSLRSPVFYEALQTAEPLTPIAAHRATENRLRHYERTSLPERLVVLGDAACAFNPVYGQGMTMAALAAQCLDQALQRQPNGDLTGLTSYFQRQLARTHAVPWQLATSEDLRYSTVQGGSPNWQTRFLHAYLDQILWLSGHSVRVRRQLLTVLNLMAAPTVLFHPGILGSVIRATIAQRWRSQKQPIPSPDADPDLSSAVSP